MQYCDVITSPRWRTAAILKIAKSPYLSEKSSNFDKIWYTAADIEPNDSHVTKNWNFWNSRWRWPSSWKSFFGHNSSTNCPISAKFCMRKQNGMSTRARWQKLQIFKTQDGRRPPFWKSLNRKIVWFWWNLVHYIRYWTRLQSCDQKLKFFKFKMATAAILKIAFLAINRWSIVWFQRNFLWRSRTAGRQGLYDKLQIFKIKHGGRPPFWKSLNYYYLSENIVGFWQN